jgi:hypothetical protein
MSEDKLSNYDICLKSQNNAHSSEFNVHFHKRGIFVLEIGDNDQVSLLLGNKDGSVTLTLTIPNADFLHLVDRYVSALRSSDNDELANEAAPVVNQIVGKSLARLRTIINRS